MMNLETANAKLHRVKLRQKGDRLYLRATLPPKTGDGKWKQTDVATGCPATDKGLKLALAKAQKLESELLLERFTWESWTAGTTATDKPATLPTQNWERAIAAFEKEYWQINQKTPSKAEYYRDNYTRPFLLLPPDEPPSIEKIRQVLVDSTPPDTRIREKHYRSYTALAKYLNLDLPPGWSKLKGKYRPTPRHIPTDQEILEKWEGINSSRWRWAYALMATYGIRNHELVRITLDFPRIHVWDETKTNYRIVYPLLPDWPELFTLHAVDYPQLTSDINSHNGRVVTKAFKRHDIGFPPYSLRHAYAIRAARLGVPPAIAAKWMGHSLTIHHQTYHRWIEQSSFDSVWESLKSDPTH